MDSIILTATVGNNHEIILNVPPEVPIGTVLQVVLSSNPSDSPEIIRALLSQSGRLAALDIPEDQMEDISDEELQQIGRLIPGAPTIDEFIRQDRESR